MSQFILVYDSMLDHAVLRLPGEPVCREAAWVRLLFQARRTRGEGLDVGQLRTSHNTLAEQWGWSRQAVRRFITALTKEGMLRVESSSAGLLVTIVKFAAYQRRRGAQADTPSDMPTDTPLGMSTDTPAGMPTDTPSDTAADTPKHRAQRAEHAQADTVPGMPTDTPASMPADTPQGMPVDTPTDTPTGTIHARFHEQVQQVINSPLAPRGGTERGNPGPVRSSVPPLDVLRLDGRGTSVELAFRYPPDSASKGLLRAAGFRYGPLSDGREGWTGPASQGSAAALDRLGIDMPRVDPPTPPPPPPEPPAPQPEPEPFRAAGDLDAMRCVIVMTIGDDLARRYLADGSLTEDGDTLVVRCRDAHTAGLAELYVGDAIHGAAVSAGYSQVRFESRREAA